jgi:hypothetical protein
MRTGGVQQGRIGKRKEKLTTREISRITGRNRRTSQVNASR